MKGERNMLQPRKMRYDKAGPMVAEKLKKRHFDAYYCSSREEAVAKLESWLKAANINDDGIKQIRKIVDYPETAKKMEDNRDIVENQLRVKGIPTLVYDGKRHTGLWKE